MNNDARSGLRSGIRLVVRHPLDAAAWIALIPLAVASAVGWAPQSLTRLAAETQPDTARDRRNDLVSFRPRDLNPREPSEQTERFFTTCAKRMDEGWTVRRLLAIDSAERLNFELDRALPENTRYELGALTGISTTTATRRRSSMSAAPAESAVR